MPSPTRTAADLGRPNDIPAKFALLDRVLAMSRAEKLAFADRIEGLGPVPAELAVAVRRMARIWHGDC